MPDKEYIERDKVLALQTDLHFDNIEQLKHWKCRHIDPTEVQFLPAADVRPVVFCKDCKYYFKDADGYEMCENSEGYDHVTEDGFCAWAKKREEN